MKTNKIILDCDTGEDDALAILVALANKLTLSYIVTSYGNTSVKNSTLNTSRILSLANAYSVKVIKGSKKPLVKHPIEREGYSAGSFVGENGLCNVKLPVSKYKNIINLQKNDFVDVLIKIINKEGPFDYIITGPCTNFAKVCNLLGPEIKKYINQVYIMGGAMYSGGNSGPLDPKTLQHYAEFNFYCDPYSANIILKSGLKINLITWDVTSKLTLSYNQISKFNSKTKTGQFAIKLMKSFFKHYGLSNDRNFELNDPLTIIAYLGLGSFIKKKITLSTEGLQAGRVVINEKGYPIQYFQVNGTIAISKILKDLGIF